jgi:hypothetical protein
MDTDKRFENLPPPPNIDWCFFLDVDGTLLEIAENPNAVRVEWQGHKLGYAPRADNQALARFMDRGSQAEARITRLKKSRNPWQRIEFEVYLDITNPIQEKAP